MGIETRLSISDPLRLIDFYGSPYNLGIIFIQLDNSLTTSTSAIRYASSSIDAFNTTVFVAFGNRQARSTINIDSVVTSSPTKIASGVVDLPFGAQDESFASVNVNAIKIAKSQTTILPDVSTTTNTNKFSYASASPSLDTTVSPNATEILFASSAVSTDLTTDIFGRRIKKSQILIANLITISFTAGKTATAELDVNIQIGLICTLVKFAGNNAIDTAGYRTLLVLDDKPLTDQGRTLSSELGQLFIENKNWNNSKSRYYKRPSSSGRTSFSLSWSYLPDSRYDTVDKRFARDFIKEIASDPDIHTLKIINQDVVGANAYTETQYNVYVRDYSETLIRRDINNDIYLWDCTLTLEEA